LKDIRLSLGFWDHWKTVTLEAELGFEAVKSLQILWCFAAQNKPSGVLSGMPKRAVAIASKYQGDREVFIDMLIELRFLDFDGESYSLHDWEEHNGFVATSEQRSEQARKAINSRWEKKRGIQQNNEQNQAVNTERNTERNTPSPSPSPSPSPKEKSVICDPTFDQKSNVTGCADHHAPPEQSKIPEKRKQQPKPPFRAPTLEQVSGYCKERSSPVDPARFVDHYTANGWRVGKAPMKDWQAAVRNWERGDNHAVQKRDGPVPPEQDEQLQRVLKAKAERLKRQEQQHNGNAEPKRSNIDLAPHAQHIALAARHLRS
jgi:hypothetical protein